MFKLGVNASFTEADVGYDKFLEAVSEIPKTVNWAQRGVVGRGCSWLYRVENAKQKNGIIVTGALGGWTRLWQSS